MNQDLNTDQEIPREAWQSAAKALKGSVHQLPRPASFIPHRSSRFEFVATDLTPTPPPVEPLDNERRDN